MTLPDGWLTDAEADELRRLADGLVVLELGAWKGRSTVALADTAKYVFSVDRHRGIEGHGESLTEYLKNIRSIENVYPVLGEFEYIVPHLYGIDMVYIDGDHDAVSVERDTRLARNTANQIIAYHDWDFPEVRAGAAAGGMPQKEHALVGSVASFVHWS